jgi:uncharacterized protein (DUF302 family)
LSNDYFHTGAGARYLRRAEGSIDLPLKALVWQAAAVKTWISYNQPDWIAQGHGVANAEDTVTKMADLLNAIPRTAVDPKP